MEVKTKEIVKIELEPSTKRLVEAVVGSIGIGNSLPGGTTLEEAVNILASKAALDLRVE